MSQKKPRKLSKDQMEELVNRTGMLSQEMLKLSQKSQQAIPLLWAGKEDGELTEKVIEEGRALALEILAQGTEVRRRADGLSRYMRDIFPEP